MNEFDLIESYFNWPITDSNLELGIGDDAALFCLNSEEQLVVSTDTLSEGVHFFKDASPIDVSYKSLAVNLSDIAAMGAVPKYFTLSLTIPTFNHDWLQQFSVSLKDASQLFNVSLIGGDTTKGPLNITITMMGSIEKSMAIRRSGAKNGDDIYVSGNLGDAALCLKKINEGVRPTQNQLNKLNRPIPRIELGSALKNVASSCIDISDGLEQDLSHILKSSKVGAKIDIKSLPLGDSTKEYIKKTDDWSLALCGGDDYELCFTADKSMKLKINKLSDNFKIGLTKIGEINSSGELEIVGYDGPRSSYQHF